jgi:hypothetical protein
VAGTEFAECGMNLDIGVETEFDAAVDLEDGLVAEDERRVRLLAGENEAGRAEWQVGHVDEPLEAQPAAGRQVA